MKNGDFLLHVMLYAAIGEAVSAQTKVDLSNQSRNIDFSAAALTKPFKSGTVLPAACSTGEAFFKTNATAGQNLYGCVATDTWMILSGGSAGSLPAMTGQTGKVLSNNGAAPDWRAVGGDVNGAPDVLTVSHLQGRTVSGATPTSGQALVWNATLSQWEPGAGGGGGGGVTTGAQLAANDYTPVRTSNTGLTVPVVPAFTFGVGAAACTTAVSSAAVTIASGTGTLWIGMGSDCTVKVRHNVVLSCAAGCAAIGGASGFDMTDLPLYEWTVTGGVLAASGAQRLTPYLSKPLAAGANITLATSGGVTTISSTGASVAPLAAETTAYQYEEFIGGGECLINTTVIGKLSWRVGSTNGGETVSCTAETTAARPGTVTINTGASSGNEVALWLPSGAIHSGSAFTVRFFFKLSSSSSVQAIAGLVNGPWQGNGGTVNGVYLEKESADTNWFATTESSSTRTRTDTGVAVNSGWVVAQIRRGDTSTIGFKIAATVAGIDAATEVSVTTNIPTASLVPAFMVRNTTASARELAADYYDIRITGLSR